MKVRKIVTLAVLISMSTVLSILETFIPTGVPGVKIGLANVVTLIVLYMYSKKDALLVQVLRIFLVGLIYSGIFSVSFLLSLSGGLLSIALMILVYRIKKSNIFVVSIIGSAFHAIGQIAMSFIFIKSSAIIYYLPFIFTLSIPCGIFTAILSKIVLKAFKIETDNPKILSISLTIIVLIVTLSLTIMEYNYKKESDKGTVASIYYNNDLIMNIELSNPKKYKSYSSSFIEMNIDGDSYLYTFKVYNIDEKIDALIIVEVKAEEIRIKEETCKKHFCSKRGFIKTKYESIICLPNNFIISLSNYDLDEIDIIM